MELNQEKTAGVPAHPNVGTGDCRDECRRLLLKKASLSTMLTSFLEEIVVLTIVCLANRFWLGVPIHLKSELSFWQQVKTNGDPYFYGFERVLTGHGQTFYGHSALLVLLALLIAIFEEHCLEVSCSAVSGFANNVRGRVGGGDFSSLLFAASHLINLSHQSLTMTVGQVLMAFGFGLLTSAMYLRTGAYCGRLRGISGGCPGVVNTGLLQQG